MAGNRSFGPFKFTRRLGKARAKYEVDALDERENWIYTLILDAANRKEGLEPFKTFFRGVVSALYVSAPLLLGAGIILYFALAAQGGDPLKDNPNAQSLVVAAALAIFFSPLFLLGYALKTILRWWGHRFRLDTKRRFGIFRRRVIGMRLGRGLSVENSGRALVLIIVISIFHFLVALFLFVDDDRQGQEIVNDSLLVVADNVARGVLFDIMEVYELSVGPQVETGWKYKTTFFIFRLTTTTLVFMLIAPLFIVWKDGLFKKSLYMHNRHADRGKISERFERSISNADMIPTLLFLQIAAAYMRKDDKTAKMLIDQYGFLKIGSDVKALFGDRLFPGAEQAYKEKGWKKWKIALIILTIIGGLALAGQLMS